MPTWIGLLVFAGMLSPQPRQLPTVKPEEYAGLAGKVVNAITGAPVRKARVTVRLRSAAVDELEVQTDGGGGFAVTQLMPGQYSIWARAIGFVTAAGDYDPSLRLEPGTKKTDWLIKLVPQGVVTGRVLDEDGDPVMNARVQLVAARRRLGVGTGGKVLIHSNVGSNDQGEFRLSHISPGQYLLTADYTRYRPHTTSSPTAAPPPEYALARTYYPSSLEVENAAPIRVTPGVELRGVDIRLRRSRAYRLNGRVAGFPRCAQSDLTVERLTAVGADYVPGASVSDDGSFAMEGLVPGRYLIRHLCVIQGRPESEARLSGAAQANVIDQDVTGVVVTPTPRFRLTGKIESPPPATAERKLFLHLEPTTDYNSPADAAIEDTGLFRLDSVEQGHYRIKARGLPEGTYLAAVTTGGRDLLSHGVEVSASQEIAIRLGSDGGQVTAILDEAKQGSRDVLVLLWPSAEARFAPHRCRFAPIESNRQGRISGVEPGRYKIIAVPVLEEENFDLFSPPFLKLLERQADEVEIPPAGAVTKQLKLKALPELE